MGPETIRNTETDAMWAEDQLNRFRSRFDPVLGAFLARETEAATMIRPELTELLKVSAEFIMAGGKRLRPAFTYFGYKAIGGQDDETILRAAIPMELVHAGALVHDDVMDNSDIRRGKPTVHKVFEKSLGSKATGTATAIVAGDQPAPDLVIRTGMPAAEIPRTSGFMPLQTAYSGWKFIPELFPDLTPEVLSDCIKDFLGYEKRMGK